MINVKKKKDSCISIRLYILYIVNHMILDVYYKKRSLEEFDSSTDQGSFGLN